MHGEIEGAARITDRSLRREVRLDDVRFENGMRLFRVTNRGGKRINVLDVDPPPRAHGRKTMTQWAERAAGPKEKA